MSTQTITADVRRVLGDQGESFLDQVQGDGKTTRFELPEENLEPTNPAPVIALIDPTGVVNPQVLVVNTDYIIDARFGVVTLVSPLAANRVLLVQGVAYREFEPTDIQYYIDTAWALYTKGRTPSIYLDPVIDGTILPPQLGLPPEEVRVFEIAVVLEALWDLATDASQDIDITTPDGVQIPRGQYYRQIMEHIQALQGEYERMAKNLNVGLERIEMFNLRRISRTTNRYIPEYVPREFDQRTFPQRVLPAVDTGAGSGNVITSTGLWFSTVVYKPNDLVYWKGAQYLCVIQNTNVQPDTDVNSAGLGPHWQVSNINGQWYGAL